MISVHPTPPNPDTPKAYAYNYRLLLGETLDELAHTITHSVWSPNTFKRGHRHGDNFQSSFYMVLDFDNGNTTLQEAARLFCDYRGIIGTSKSHGIVTDKNPDAHDRFRVVIPWERPICDPVVYAYNMELLMDEYDCDVSCVDTARFYFPCKEIEAISDGPDYYSFTVREPSEEYRKSARMGYTISADDLAKIRMEFHQCGRLWPWMEHFIQAGKLPKENYSRRVCFFRIALHLYMCGASEDFIFRLLISGKYDKKGLGNQNQLAEDIRGRMRSAKKRSDANLLAHQIENPDAKVLSLDNREPK